MRRALWIGAPLQLLLPHWGAGASCRGVYLLRRPAISTRYDVHVDRLTILRHRGT